MQFDSLSTGEFAHADGMPPWAQPKSKSKSASDRRGRVKLLMHALLPQEFKLILDKKRVYVQRPILPKAGSACHRSIKRESECHNG
jgi:hypothetical protein